jgi:hypothetical protein
MNVQEIDVLHRRYVTLSHRFRAAWVHHQFVQSLRKVFADIGGGQHAGDFQLLYTALKEVSEGLSASETRRTQERLDQIGKRLSDLTAILVEEDTKVTPERLRQFFQRYQKHDEKIFLQLARFYVEAAGLLGWPADLQDKLDFLLTRLAQQEAEGGDRRYLLADRRRLVEVLQSLSVSRGDGEITNPAEIERRCREAEAIRAELGAVSSLDDLQHRQLLKRYRNLKQGLGRLLLDPVVGLALLETNLSFKNVVYRLHRREERLIVADYQEIFELEGAVPVDEDLEAELKEFRRDVEEFEQRLQDEDFRLADLARIRDRVRTLKPRLAGAGGSSTVNLRPPTGPVPVPRPGEGAAVDPEEALLAGELEEIQHVIEEVPAETPPKIACLKPEIYAFRLEAREVTAHRRLKNQAEKIDVALETFVLRAAALRVRMGREVEEIKGLLDESYRSSDAPVYGTARTSLKLADNYLWRYEHWIHQLLLDGRQDDARRFQVLRMRLMRECSGLWLLAYKPFLDLEG